MGSCITLRVKESTEAKKDWLGSWEGASQETDSASITSFVATRNALRAVHAVWRPLQRMLGTRKRQGGH